MAFLKQHAELGNFMETLVRDSDRYRPIVQFLDNIVYGSKELSWRDLEVIGLEVSKTIGASFCSNLRKGMIDTLNGNQENVKDLGPLLDFSKEIIKSPQEIKENHINNLRNAGWSDQTIEDVIGWVSILQAYSVMDLAFGFDGLPQEVFSQIALGTVESKGYTPSFEYFVGLSES